MTLRLALFSVPLGLLAGLSGWGLALLLLRGTDLQIMPMAALGVAIALGVYGNLKPSRWKDTTAMVALGTGFLWAAIFVALLDVLQLYLFASLAMFTLQQLNFRTNVATATNLPLSETTFRRELGSTYVSSLIRGVLMSGAVFLISTIAFATAAGFIFGLRADFTAFLLAFLLIVLTALLATLPR